MREIKDWNEPRRLEIMGLVPHRQTSEILVKSARRKDGQFRSGGPLVGDRPFSFRKNYQEPSANREVTFLARSPASRGRVCRSLLTKSEPTRSKVKPEISWSRTTLPEMRSRAVTRAVRLTR